MVNGGEALIVRAKSSRADFTELHHARFLWIAEIAILNFAFDDGIVVLRSMS